LRKSCDKSAVNITLHQARLKQEFVIDGLDDDGEAFMLGSGSLVHIDVKFLKKTGGYSLFEKYGDKKIRCILRSPEFIEQQL
jgi:hypothetical protein